MTTRLTTAHLDVVDDELLETVWANVSGLGVGAVTDLWHQVETLEASADTIVNTLWLSPVGLL